MERFFDIIFSLVALVLLAPLLLSVSVILKITGEGEIFFLQERVGKHAELFKLFKFATMLKNSPNIATGTVTIKNDPRVLPFGNILRKTKINELPQLLNILLGHISVIGPRPLTIQTFNSYPDTVKKSIELVKPGLSGIGSIIFRDEENLIDNSTDPIVFYNDVIAPYKGMIEEWFVANKNLYIYFLAIFMTIWVVFFPKSSIPWKVFIGLPTPPKELQEQLNYKK